MAVRQKKVKTPAAGDRKREADAARQRSISSTARDIGAIPKIANVARRRKCKSNLRLFCETYLYQAFTLDWSQDHLDDLKRIEEAAFIGALYAIAAPRGDGKTVRCRAGAFWAVVNGHVPYAFLIGSNAEKGRDALDSLKIWMRFLPEFGEDYPEIAVAVRAMQGIAQRGIGQLCEGESTLLEWGKDRVFLPTVPCPPNWPKNWAKRSDGKAPTSGEIIGASGLTGEGIRGSVITLSTGEMRRPKLILLDDPQTDESAHSKTQNTTRKKLIHSAILGLAGPGEKISAVMPCTVIARGDAIDETLDRGKHPLWRGIRRGILRSMPKDLKAWDAYFEVYDECALSEPPDFAAANEYYQSHRAELDEGAEASWEERKEPGDVSAIQHAMHLYHRDPFAFWSEYMNAPLDEESALVSRKLDANAIKERFTHIPRLIVPRESTRLTAFVDCGGEVLWYAIAALDERFSGNLIDYGSWPVQPRDYFAKSNPPRTLADQYPNLKEDQLLYQGLLDLTSTILNRRYVRHQTDDSITIGRCLIDEGWSDKVVYQFCRESPHTSILLPSKGHVPKSLGHTPMARWAARPGERAAKAGQPSWRVGPVGSGKGRHVIFETNEWKTFASERLTTPPGGAGCLRLFGDEKTNHAMFADHCTAEIATSVTVDGRRFDRWMMKPTRDDNDLFDCAVGCLVASAIDGLEWFANSAGKSTSSPVKRKMSDIIAAKSKESRPALEPQTDRPPEPSPAPADTVPPVPSAKPPKRKLADIIRQKQAEG